MSILTDSATKTGSSACAPVTPLKFQAGDFKSDLTPIWCPGCGDFGVVTALTRALAAIGRPPHEIAFVSGIGCSSRIPGYTTAYGFNTVHGRSLPIAQGIKLANPELLVLVASGDGDGFSIGGGHVAHVIRRNINLTYIVMDNQIYGLTKGQLSPTSSRGRKTVTSSFGSLEEPVNPLLYVMGYGANYVAQGTPADMAGLAKIIEEGIRYPGFAFINVQSPCVTYGMEDQQLKAHKTNMQSLEAMGHDTSDRAKATELAREYGSKLHTGVLYRNPNPPATYGDGVTERHTALKAQAVPRHEILNRFMPTN
jgi:2-oxoglutarate ferredoxin oxidoreductase subunit beta